MTPELETRIRATVLSLQGWCSPDKAVDLANAILKTKATVSVQIGVFAGRSLIPMAMAHAEQKHGIVWGIDPWSPQESIKGQGKADTDWWSKVDHDLFYRSTLDSVQRLDLTPFVNIIRARSDDVTPPPVIDVVEIDGNHSEQSIRDVDRFASCVRDGGFCFLDDLGWSNGGPAHAADRLLQIGFVEVARRDDAAIYQRHIKMSPTVANVRGKGRPRKAK